MATPLSLDRSSYSSRELHADVARLAGHVADPTLEHDGHHWESPEEQFADAFALADPIPDRMLREVQTVGFRGGDLERWTRAEVQRFGKGWPEPRLCDRAATLL